MWLVFRITGELAVDPEPPMKKRKRSVGVHKSDISLQCYGRKRMESHDDGADREARAYEA